MPPTLADRTAALRRFNRFYTRRIGVLQEGLEASPFTLAESRLLWELAHAEESLTAGALAQALDLDAGYTSRLLRRLRERRLVKASRSSEDARQVRLALTAAGRKAFAPLDERSQAHMRALLAPLPEHAQHELVQAAAAMERLLSPTPAAQAPSPFLLRAPRPGDIGWVVARHGVLYAEEYGWDQRFEALVAHIAARFVEQFDAAREACWIAERDGHEAGCVFLVQARDEHSDRPLEGIAQLRMLLVEPSARGHGLGATLVRECERFARRAGYRRIRLWTNSVLLAARSIYEKQGYRLVAREPHESFGKKLVGETWELALSA